MCTKKILLLLSFSLLILFFNGCSSEEDLNENEVKSNEFKVTYNNQILNKYSVVEILKIIESQDGFIIFTKESMSKFIIRVTKIDRQFNEIWSFVINEGSSESNNEFGGVFELSNDEFIAVVNAFERPQGVISGVIYGVKFNSAGNISWKKKYVNPRNNYEDPFFFSNDLVLPFESNSDTHKFIIMTDSIKGSFVEQFYNELTVDRDFNILNEQYFSFPKSTTEYLGQMKYDIFGNKFTYGSAKVVEFFVGDKEHSSMDAAILKYDVNNNILFHKMYGQVQRNEKFEHILVDNNKVITIGEYGDPRSSQIFRRWITQIDGNSGNITWQIIQDNPLLGGDSIKYYARHICFDEDGSYLALFSEASQKGSCSTLIKINKQGQILWTFTDNDKEGLNSYDFNPFKVVPKNGEYIIFGSKGSKLWIKKVKK